MLKLWGRANSINVQKVAWTLAELDLPYERIEAGMAFGKVAEPWYRAMNPNAQIPTIDDGGTVLWESNVIVRYLAAKYAPGKLIPTDPAARAQAEMWMDWQQSAVYPGLGPVFIGLIRTPLDQRNHAVIEAGRKSAEAALQKLDAHLEKRTYIASETLGVADIALGPVAYRWKSLPIERAATPHLDAWYQRLVARPAFAKHVMLPVT